MVLLLCLTDFSESVDILIESFMLCMICPTATAAVVVTDKLGDPTGPDGSYTKDDIIRASAEDLAACDFAVVFMANPSTGSGYDDI